MDTYRQQAALLKAIAHPVRLQIVDMIRSEPECVCHLSAALGKTQPYISQQLAILRNARVIVDEREGPNIFYRLADDNLVRQVAAVCCDSRVSDAHQHDRAHQALACCTCPKCAAARGAGAEVYLIAC